MLDYHKIVQDGIKQYGRLCKDKGVTNVSQRRLVIHHPTNKKFDMQYKPDVTYTVDRMRYAFQILGSQGKKKREIEADIFRAFLSPEVSKLIFIVSDKTKWDMVNGINQTIKEGLIDYGINLKAIPIFIVIKIPESITTSKEVVDYLKSVKASTKLFV